MLINSHSRFLPPVQENEFLPPIGRWIIFGGVFIIATVGLSIPLASGLKYKETVKVQAALRPTGKYRSRIILATRPIYIGGQPIFSPNKSRLNLVF